MTVSWPVTVPSDPAADTVSEALERNVATFSPDVGPPIERRRSSIAMSTVEFQLYLSPAQRADFIAFYRDTLASGTLPFEMTDPVTLAGTAKMRFRAAPTFQRRYSDYVASLSLLRVP